MRSPSVSGEVMAVYLGSDGHSVVNVHDGTKLPSNAIISPQTWQNNSFAVP